jgi:hypothetical protein
MRGVHGPEIRTDCGEYGDIHWDVDFGLVMHCPPLADGSDARCVNSSRIASVKCSQSQHATAIEDPSVVVDCSDCLPQELTELGDEFERRVIDAASPHLDFVQYVDDKAHDLCLSRRLTFSRERIILVTERYAGECYSECSMPFDDAVGVVRQRFSAGVALAFANLRIVP